MSAHIYSYFNETGAKDGPHDLISIMRRIRAGKITPETLIHERGVESPLPAKDIPNIAAFFESAASRETSGVIHQEDTITFKNLLATGWKFTAEHHDTTVYSGLLLLVSMMITLVLTHLYGMVVGSIVGWFIFVTLSNIYMMFVLRIYHGKTLGDEYINAQLAPVMPVLIIGCLLMGLLVSLGLLALIIPGIMIATALCFMPLLIVEKKMGIGEAMQTSRRLLASRNGRYHGTASALVVFNLVCLILIFPMPFTLPIYSIALCSLYEEISDS